MSFLSRNVGAVICDVLFSSGDRYAISNVLFVAAVLALFLSLSIDH